MTKRILLEIKKDALRQNQDGSYKVTFNIHPQDMDASLLMAAMGTRYYAEMVDADIFDQQNPPQDKQNSAQEDSGFGSAEPVQDPKVDPEPAPSVAGPDRLDGTKAIVQRAALMCKDTLFQKFIKLEYPTAWQPQQMPEGNTISIIKDLCGIKSRSELVSNTDAAEKFNKIAGQFRLWRDYEYQQGNAA